MHTCLFNSSPPESHFWVFWDTSSAVWYVHNPFELVLSDLRRDGHLECAKWFLGLTNESVHKWEAEETAGFRCATYHMCLQNIAVWIWYSLKECVDIKCCVYRQSVWGGCSCFVLWTNADHHVADITSGAPDSGSAVQVLWRSFYQANYLSEGGL